VLGKTEAHEIARKEGIVLEGLRGKKIGVIGALAACGLRHEGNDGRILWMHKLRELEGKYKAGELKHLVGLDQIISVEGDTLSDETEIDVGEWCRPVQKNGRTTLLVEKIIEGEYGYYKSASKEYIKSITE
jgi:hypothetical protein